MSAACPAAVGPMLLAALALVALLIPPMRPTVRDPDPADEGRPGEVEILRRRRDPQGRGLLSRRARPRQRTAAAPGQLQKRSWSA